MFPIAELSIIFISYGAIENSARQRRQAIEDIQVCAD
jgi:hypothetical protein